MTNPENRLKNVPPEHAHILIATHEFAEAFGLDIEKVSAVILEKRITYHVYDPVEGVLLYTESHYRDNEF